MLDSTLMKIKRGIGGQNVAYFEITGDGTLRYQGKLYVLDVDCL